MAMNLEERMYKALGKLTDKIEGWFDQMIVMLPNFVIAVLVIIVFAVIAHFSRKLTINGLRRISRNIAMNKLLASIFSAIVLGIGIFIALGVLNLGKTVTSLLAGVGVVGLALSFAFQDTATNFVSGIFMAVKYPLNVGDIVETNDHFGTVENIGTRYTIISTPQAQKVVLPNKIVIESALKNYSISGERRIDLGCGISYGDDLEKVKKIVVEAIEKIDDINKNKPIQFFYTEYDDSSINFVVRYWISFSRQPDFFMARSEGIMSIKKAFNENDITIPFPIRTLDFGIKGGEKLYEVWPEQNKNSN